MSTFHPRVLALSATLAVVAPVQAASGMLDSFSASATEVVAGNWVDFSVSWSVLTSTSAFGGSNTAEPPPQEGAQEWFVNWYATTSETLTGVSLQIDGQSTTEFVSAPAGSSSSGGWTVSLYFPNPGQYTVSAGGSWAAEFDSYYSNESAYRNCYRVDPDDGNSLFCDAWTWTYADGGDRYSIGETFASQSLSINVSAVPEPSTSALWLAGATLLAARGRRRRPCAV
jgi:PEP-CTERM motif